MRIEVQGAEGLRLVGEAVRRLGSSRAIVIEMSKEIRRAVPPFRQGIRLSALARLPKGGGLNRWAASAKVSAQIRRGSRNAGVSIKDSKTAKGVRHDLAAVNRGFVRHPLYGNREHWYRQQVRPRFFDLGVEPGVEAFQNSVLVAVDRAIEKVL